MEEKVLIKGTFSKINVFSIIFIALGIFGVLGGFISLSKGEEEAILFTFLYMLIGFGGAAFFYFLLNRCELTVTDKRVFGKAAFGRSVNLPFDMISSVGTSALKGIGVATSSGRIVFYLCQNSQEVFSVISNLLLERQKNTVKQPIVNDTVIGSNADELKKYKDLLDSGIITQEEFDAKKKQLLGL